MGYLSTSGTCWYGDERIFEEGTHEGFYTRFVPEGEEKTSLVVRNYHLSNPGQSAFTIEYLDFQQENYFSALSNELVQAMTQSCPVQEALSFSSTHRRYINLYNSNPSIWARLMETHNYPMLKLGSPTKLSFMSHHLPHRFGYYSFNDPKHYENSSLTKAFSIQVKNLHKLFEMFSLGPNHQSFFNIGEDTFSLYWTASVWLPISDGRHSHTCIPTKKHNMEHFPNCLLDVFSDGTDSFYISALIQKANVSPYSYVISSNLMNSLASSSCKTPEECMERSISIIIKKESQPPV
jgi:hypothetical protein